MKKPGKTNVDCRVGQVGKRSTLHFVVRNEQRFPLLLETNKAFRIVTQTYFNSDHTIDFCVVKVFMVLLETKKEFLKLS